MQKVKEVHTYTVYVYIYEEFGSIIFQKMFSCFIVFYLVG